MAESIVLPRIGGMVTERASMAPGSSLLALDVSFDAHGCRGRPGFDRLYPDGTSIGNGTQFTLSCRGVHTYRSPWSEADYIVAAGYEVPKVGQTYPNIEITVWADGNRIVTSEFSGVLDTTQPFHMARWRDTLFVSTRSDSRLFAVRFQRTGVTIEVIRLQDRDLFPLFAGDDPGPWVSRAPRGGPITVHEDRLFLAGDQDSPGTIFIFNIGDDSALSATGFIEVGSGSPVYAMRSLNRHLMAYTRDHIYAAIGGYTSSDDTRITNVESTHGCTSHNVLEIEGTNVFINERGVFQVTPNAPAQNISGSIAALFSGGSVDVSWGSDFARYVPNRGSFAGAPAAYLPTTREVVFALSTGAATGAVEQFIGRDILLHGRLPEPGRPGPVDWGVWRYPGFCDALHGYTDSIGQDRLLAGTSVGAVQLLGRDGVDVRELGSATALLSNIASSVRIGPGSFPQSSEQHRTQVRHIQLQFVERYDTATALTILYPAGRLAGDDVGSKLATPAGARSFTIAGRRGAAALGDAFPITIQTSQTRVARGGFRAFALERNGWLEIGGTPMPPVLNPVVLSVSATHGR
jgi:hypothetical protein